MRPGAEYLDLERPSDLARLSDSDLYLAGRKDPLVIPPPDEARLSPGLFPVPRRPSQSERDALLEAGRRMQEEMARLGISEDELAADFKAWRKKQDAA